MKNLQDILYGVSILEVVGSTDVHINSIETDSRKIGKDDVFIAIKGIQVDGHKYITTAIEKGATGIVCDQLPEKKETNVTYIRVANCRIAAGTIANNYFENPSKLIKLVGVTGTNGKTTIATLLYRLFMGLGKSTGLLSTIENKINAETLPATHTTPNVIQFHALLRKMVDAGCEFAFMEVSSHAVAQQRIAGATFSGGVFSNLSHDHLDYHKNFKAYLIAKKAFFDELPKTSFALTNKDDKNGDIMLQNTKASKFSYGLRHLANYKSKILENTFNGLFLNIDGADVYTRLIGDFNAANLTAVYATAVLLNQEKEAVLIELSKLKGAEGRFDHFISNSQQIVGIIDYAHTPDALEKVLKTIGVVRSGNEQLITLVGCGGDRDPAKRPLMANIATSLSNKVILTSDNPRSENPETILDQMETGVKISNKRKTMRITSRKEAIRTACIMANANDIILVAGKGHEKYQDIDGKKFPFNDKKILVETLNELNK